jgi:hypothetical protein
MCWQKRIISFHHQLVTRWFHVEYQKKKLTFFSRKKCGKYTSPLLPSLIHHLHRALCPRIFRLSLSPLRASQCDLSIVGSTAIEDRLQDGVPDCIEHLGNAGIKIWVCVVFCLL